MKFKLKLLNRKNDFDRINDIIELSKKNGLLFDIQLNYKNEFICNLSNSEKLAKRVRVSNGRRKTENEDNKNN